MLIDVAISGDRNVIKKEAEKILKYKDLTTEIQRMWNVKTKVIPVIIGATGTISKSFRKYVSNIPGNHEVKELQKTKKYIGQTARPFKIRFHEHLRDFKLGNGKSSFAQHLIENGHLFSQTQDTMEIVQLTTNVQMMDTLEKFYIYRETKINNQVNSRMTVKSNIIFDTIVCNDPHRGLPNTYSA